MSSLSEQLPLPLPEAIRPWLTLNAEFHILVCHAAECQQAINPDHINNHLSRAHTVKLEYRKQLAEYLKQWQWPYDFRSAPLPADRSLPQPVLPIIHGFQCQDCAFKTTNRSIVRQHHNTEHQKKRLPDEQLFRAVQLQTWFTAKRARYWVVDVDATRPADGTNNGNEGGYGHGSGGGRDNEDVSATIKAEVAQWMKEEEEEVKYKASTMATEVDPWLHYTGWEEVLASSKHGLVETAAFAATATVDEPELEILSESWERILLRSLETLQAVSGFKDILKWWASPLPDTVLQNPFEAPEPRSIRKYSQTFIRLLFYVMRTATESIDDESETGVIFSTAQLFTVKNMRDVLAVAVAEGVADETALDTAVFRLILRLIKQNTIQLARYEPPVMHYLAVRGIDIKTQGFYPSFRYTPFLAHMIWMIRLLILESTLSEHGWPDIGIKSRKELGAVAEAVADSVQLARKGFLCEGSYSTASSILSQLAYGQKLNRNYSSEANIDWSDDRQTVFFDGKGVAIAKVRVMCQSLTDELEGLLHGLLFHQDVPVVPLPQLVDSMGMAQRFQVTGYSFLDHPDNSRWKMSWEFLYQRMLRNGETLVKGGSCGSSGGRDQLGWAEQPCKAYLAREKQFLLKLLVAMHISGGQPARSPEIGSIKVRNSLTSSRNIFVINGRVAVVTTYDKARKRRGKTEYVFRCFPDQLSQIIIRYLVYILPLIRVLQKTLQKTKGDFLFATEEEPWVQNQLSQALAVATTKHLGVRLTISSWRHIAIAIGDEHLRKASRIWKQDQEVDDDGVVGADESDGDVEQNMFEQILVRQSGHSKRTAELHYAIDGAFLNRLGPDLVNVYSQASRAWHAFLHMESKGAAVAVAVAVKRNGSPLQPLSKRPKVEESKAIQGLQKILGSESQPKSEGQAHALELVHHTTVTHPQIIILGTGSGKSILFFSVAAMASQQTVLVVVPFAALIDDLVARARRAGLSCEEWQWQRQWTLLPQLLIVSADRAIEGGFLHFAKGLELNKQLAHVFFDECHVAVTDTSYRAKLRELWQLRYLTCPFTCLTATLLPVLEPVLRANLLLAHASIYRQSTMRPTIRYQVIDCYGHDIWDTAEPLIRQLPLPLGSRGVIYVRSYAHGESVAEELECPFYKATATDKQQILEQWAHGSGGWIVATGALGTGIDIPGVVYIIHLGRPYGLTSFMQQAGRGGRAGEISDSIVILPSGGSGSKRGQFPAPRQELVNAYSIEAEDEAALTAYLESSSCRRVVLAQHLDGHLAATSCIATDSILCDYCLASVTSPEVSIPAEDEGEAISGDCGSGSSSGLEVGSEAIHQVLYEEVSRNEQLTRFHQLLHAHCIYCILMQGEEESHCHSDCPFAAEQNCSIMAYRQWRSRLRLATRHQCFRCGLSQSMCTAIADGISCLYPHLMLPAFYFFQQTGYLITLCHDLGFQGEQGERQWQWLNQEADSTFGQREVNWIRAWRRIAEIWEED